MPPALILCGFPGVVLFFEKNIKNVKKGVDKWKAI